MMFKNLAAALLFSSFACAFLQSDFLDLEERQTTDAIDCPTTGVHVIAVSGDNVPSSGAGSYGLLSNLSTSILDAIPGSTTVQVPYIKNETGQGLVTTTEGSANFTKYVNEFHESCPCSKVVVIGYSAGAIITMNSLCGASSPWTSPAKGFNTSYEDFIVAVIVYGDETRTPTAPYNLGTCVNGGTYPRSAANAKCPNFADRIESYCDSGDPDCCLGDDLEAHFLYDVKYDYNSTKFIKAKNDAFGDVCSSNSTSSSSNSSSSAAVATSSSNSSYSLASSASTTASSSAASTLSTSSSSATASSASATSASSSTSSTTSTTSSATASTTVEADKSAAFATFVPQWLTALCVLLSMAIFA